jgi:hypothetical protein
VQLVPILHGEFFFDHNPDTTLDRSVTSICERGRWWRFAAAQLCPSATRRSSVRRCSGRSAAGSRTRGRNSERGGSNGLLLGRAQAARSRAADSRPGLRHGRRSIGSASRSISWMSKVPGDHILHMGNSGQQLTMTCHGRLSLYRQGPRQWRGRSLSGNSLEIDMNSVAA